VSSATATEASTPPPRARAQSLFTVLTLDLIPRERSDSAGAARTVTDDEQRRTTIGKLSSTTVRATFGKPFASSQVGPPHARRLSLKCR
jgi:hypothetical protein